VPEKTPSGSPAAPGTPGAVESPAGLALAIEYRNDERIPRDAKGGIVLTPEVLEELRNVKPILVAVPDLTVPPEKAGELGVSPGLTVTARVAITLTMPRGGFGAPVLMAPTAIAVTDLRREPPPPLTAQQQSALESFIRGKMAETRWFPALDQGVPEETSTETFDVEIAGSEAAAPAGTGKGTPARVPESPGTKAPGGPGPGGTGTNAPPGAVKAPGRPEATKAAPEGAKTPGPSEGPGTKTPGAPGPEPSKERPAEPSPPTPGPPGGDEKKGTP